MVLNMTPRFTFDAMAHTYRIGNQWIPSLHQILNAAGVIWNGEQSDALERGSLVHALCLQRDLGTLYVEYLISPVRGYVLAYQDFIRKMQPRYDVLEEPYFVQAFCCGTTVDRAGALHGPMVLEIKTGSRARWHGLQLAIHVLGLDGRASSRRRLAVYLQEDGSFHLVEYPDLGDFHAAQRCLEDACQQDPRIRDGVVAARRLLHPKPSRSNRERSHSAEPRLT